MRHALSLFLACIIFLILAEPVASFGAGYIPNYTYLNDKAFRHGDIEEILPTLVKKLGGTGGGGGGGGGGSGGSGGWLAFVASFLSFGSGRKFTKMDMKRIYFGNWLRDYSQALDIAALKKITAHTLVMIVSVFGFMAFGFSTAEFEVTPERLGVYLPVEHIDNPKGYGEKEGDAREFHPMLRAPLHPQELEIDPNNGMKNYIATEGHAWDTSSAHVRRTLQECIARGRKAHGKENEDQWEAFRLLGSALHTLEDLLAHSNWCELALRKLGHAEVFCHVGDDVLVETPGGPAPPLVTGTFGSVDFIFSVLSEGVDRLSEASMSRLAGTIEEVRNQGESHLLIIKTLLSKLSILGDATHGEKLEEAENLKRKAYDFDPDEVAPEEVQQFLWHVLAWRDRFFKDILMGMEKIPGLSALLEEITDTLNAFIFTVLDPILKPILQDAVNALQERSAEVIDTADQFEVFTDSHASDPSHSVLSKDHFELILNEPAGKVARAVVEYTVNLVVKMWHDEDEDVNAVIDKILQVLHHPYFATSNSEVQCRMMDHLKQWIDGLKPRELEETIQALTKESVREGKNKRLEKEEEQDASRGEEQTAVTHELNGQELVELGNTTTTVSPEAERKTEDRGMYYEIRRGDPIYSRFDGVLQPPKTKVNWKQRYYLEKREEEFWKNPHGRPRNRAPSQQYRSTWGFRRPAHAVYPSYAGHRAYDTAAIENPCAPSPALAAAEAGYISIQNQYRERYDPMRWRRAGDVVDDEYDDPFDPFEKRGDGGYDERFAPAGYGYSRTGKAPDFGMESEEEEEGPWRRPPRPSPPLPPLPPPSPPAAAASASASASRVGRSVSFGVDGGKGGTTYHGDDDDSKEAPAFFVRTSDKEGPYTTDTGTYQMVESPSDTKDYNGGGGAGVKREEEEEYDTFAENSRNSRRTTKATLPQYEPFAPE